VLRSYLGKAFDETRDFKRATSELGRAKELDPNDPTAWLYSAVLNQQHNRVNDAIRDMERSRELNENRQLYRSRLLLDQDLAVREANLAAIYQDAGLYDQSVREAARAVGSDYANPSAHLFLANSYAELGGANPANLRYETVSLSEYLVAELLSPVGGTALSPYVSQQEYTRMFQRDGFGISSGTEYRDNGDWRQRGVQYGTFGNFDYALDAYYASLNGQRPNNDLQQLTLSASTRFQVTPEDTVFFQVVSTEFKSGDLLQYWDQSKADSSVRYKESQEPNIFAGYHHEWSPGSHTLMLLGRLHDDFRIDDPVTHIMTLINSNGIIVGQEFPGFSLFSQAQNSELVAYSAELQQIWKTPRNTMVIGGRYQDGRIETDADVAVVSGILTFPTGGQDTDTRLQRAVGYVYDYWEAADDLWLVGGVSYDWLSYPENIDLPPIAESQKEKDKVSPKAGVIWQPTANTAMRGSYTRSLGGVYFDNSVRLEPTQVAGFNQAYRTVMPESIAGILAGAEFQTGDVDFSYRLPTGTYLGVGAEWLQSDGTRTIGVYESQLFSSTAGASSTPQHLDYEEKSLAANINQLIGRDWSLGARYRVSDASLRRRLSDIPVGAVFEAYQKDDGVLHQLDLYAKYTHPCGFFAEAQGLWRRQESSHRNDTLLPDTSDLPGEDFWQVNVFVGYRFAHRRAELMVGGLNLCGQDYRLNPINHYAELPRERTYLVSFKFNF
jgi:tetratricopeptide (TPR) repeat protein